MPVPTKSEVEDYKGVVVAAAVAVLVVAVGMLRVVMRVGLLRLGMRVRVRMGLLGLRLGVLRVWVGLVEREPQVIQETRQSRTISSQIRRIKQRKKLPPKPHDKQ
jgi:hypothetical protein